MEILNGNKYQINRIYCQEFRLYHVSNLLSQDDCNQIINLINNENYYRSLSDSGKETIYLYKYNKIIDDINQLLHKILDIPLNKGEVIQAQVYGTNQQIEPHYDFFNKSILTDQESLLKSGQRTWTFIIYLNDVDAGGETHFIYPDIKIQPKVGQAIFWENLIDGKENYQTLHAGLPILTGRKYILTKWFRENEIRYVI